MYITNLWIICKITIDKCKKMIITIVILEIEIINKIRIHNNNNSTNKDNNRIIIVIIITIIKMIQIKY